MPRPFLRNEILRGGIVNALPLFPAGITGWTAVYRAGTAGDSSSQFTDYSGNGLHATQATGGSQYALLTGINGKAAFVNPDMLTKRFWILPNAISVDRRNHATYFVGRSRSMPTGGSRCPWNLGPGLTDLMTEFTSPIANTPPRLRTFGNGTAQTAPIWGRSGLTVLIVSASAGGLTIRVNGEQASLSAYPSGSVIGGWLGQRQDLNDWAGEIYEAGILPRPFTGGEITALEADAVARYGRPLSPPKEMCIMGDSLTEGQQSVNEMGWPWVIDNALGASWRQLSMGQGGEVASTMSNGVSSLAATFDGTKTKHVAIWMGGINDIKAGASHTTVLGYVQTWLDAMNGAGWTCLINTMAKATPAGWIGAYETERVAYNSGLSGLTGAKTIVDVAGLSALSDPTNTTYYSSDMLHWTNAGHAAVAALVQPAILAV